MTKRCLAMGLLLAAAIGCGDDDSGGVQRPVDVVDEGGNEIGTVCAEDEECGDPLAGAECCTGGKCGPDGWCSPRCENDRDCPEDFVCVDHDGSRCFSVCETDRDCPVDWLCEEKNQRMSCRFKEEEAAE